ncbi:hypothetical protein D3C87_1700030 [compost metagenome]
MIVLWHLLHDQAMGFFPATGKVRIIRAIAYQHPIAKVRNLEIIVISAECRANELEKGLVLACRQCSAIAGDPVSDIPWESVHSNFCDKSL